jgi:TolA-binding protein
MLFVLAAIALIQTNEDSDLVKTLEFQYQEKLSQVTKENNALKTEIQRFKSKKANDDSNQSAPVIIKRSESLAEQKSLYREALRQIQDEKWDDAILTMESFVHRFPKSALADHAIYWIAQVYLQKNEIALARAELERLIQNYPKGERAKRARARLLTLQLPNESLSHDQDSAHLKIR